MHPSPTLARRFWEAVEPLHTVVYYAPEPATAARALGLPRWWMGYFAGRLAPLGPLDAPAATAMCYGFAPAMVAKALPGAWAYATPDAILDTRLGAAQACLSRLLPARSTTTLEPLAVLLERAVDACRFDGRALAASWAQVRRPSQAAGRVWLAATVLREHRGDGHVATAVNAGLSGLEATLTHVATGAITRQLIQPHRGWTDTEWEDARRRLVARGLLDRTGRLTKTGGALRRRIEDDTDRLAAAPITALGETGIEDAIRLAAPLSRHLIDSGVIPVPNPIGAPRP